MSFWPFGRKSGNKQNKQQQDVFEFPIPKSIVVTKAGFSHKASDSPATSDTEPLNTSREETLSEQDWDKLLLAPSIMLETLNATPANNFKEEEALSPILQAIEEQANKPLMEEPLKLNSTLELNEIPWQSCLAEEEPLPKDKSILSEASQLLGDEPGKSESESDPFALDYKNHTEGEETEPLDWSSLSPEALLSDLSETSQPAVLEIVEAEKPFETNTKLIDFDLPSLSFSEERPQQLPQSEATERTTPTETEIAPQARRQPANTSGAPIKTVGNYTTTNDQESLEFPGNHELYDYMVQLSKKTFHNQARQTNHQINHLVTSYFEK